VNEKQPIGHNLVLTRYRENVIVMTATAYKYYSEGLYWVIGAV